MEDFKETNFDKVVSNAMKYFHSDATPALLCHKEPARRIQSPLLGALERKIPPLGEFCLLLAGSLWHKGAYNRTFLCMEATYPFYAVKNQLVGGFGCDELVLYDIRELV